MIINNLLRYINDSIDKSYNLIYLILRGRRKVYNTIWPDLRDKQVSITSRKSIYYYISLFLTLRLKLIFKPTTEEQDKTDI